MRPTLQIYYCCSLAAVAVSAITEPGVRFRFVHEEDHPRDRGTSDAVAEDAAVAIRDQQFVNRHVDQYYCLLVSVLKSHFGF